MKLSRELLIILAIQVTEVLGFSLILPFLPFYAQELGASPLVAASILSVFSVLQFLSAPVMGRLSDVYGRRPLLLLSQLSTFISFVVLGLSNKLWLVFLSRAIDGALGSNFTIAQAYISDVSSKEDRSKAMGISGMAFGIGFLIGPAIGGYLSRFSYGVPSFLAAGISLVTMFLTYLMLPETVEKKRKRMGKIKIVDLSQFKKYFSDKKISRSLWIFTTYLMAHMVWTSNFALYGGKKWEFNASNVGWVLAYIGLISIVIRGFLLPKLIDWLGEGRLKKMGVIAIVLGLLGASVVGSFSGVLLVMSFFAFGTGVARPLMMGNISRSVGGDEQGAVLGVASSLGSLAQIVGPVLGGFLLTKFFPESLLLVSIMIMVVGMGLLVYKNRRI